MASATQAPRFSRRAKLIIGGAVAVITVLARGGFFFVLSLAMMTRKAMPRGGAPRAG